MTILNCHTFEATLSSLSGIVEIDPGTLSAKLASFDGDDFPGDPPEYLWHKIVGEDRQSTGSYWYHLTRTADPDSFRSVGIQSLGQMIDQIWSLIFALIGDRQTLRDKTEFRERLTAGKIRSDYAQLFGMKVNDPLHWGPFGILVRELAFKSKEVGAHDYFQAPEIIEDICVCHSEQFGGNLLGDFYEQSKPYIIKFRGHDDRPDALRAALMYLWTKIHGEPLGFNCSTGFCGYGARVEPELILDVELVTDSVIAAFVR